MAEDKKKKATKTKKSNAKGVDPSQAQPPGFAIEKLYLREIILYFGSSRHVYTNLYTNDTFIMLYEFRSI